MSIPSAKNAFLAMDLLKIKLVNILQNVKNAQIIVMNVLIIIVPNASMDMDS